MPGATGATGATGPTGPIEPFRSAYVEVVGPAQTVSAGGAVRFDVVEGSDIVGDGIVLSADGTEFTITREGLYSVEWSLNLGGGDIPVVVSLFENGEYDSAMSSAELAGNLSSGALINVTAADIPTTFSLRSFNGEIDLVEAVNTENSAASIRVLRFADGPNA